MEQTVDVIIDRLNSLINRKRNKHIAHAHCGAAALGACELNLLLACAPRMWRKLSALEIGIYAVLVVLTYLSAVVWGYKREEKLDQWVKEVCTKARDKALKEPEKVNPMAIEYRADYDDMYDDVFMDTIIPVHILWMIAISVFNFRTSWIISAILVCGVGCVFMICFKTHQESPWS